MADSPGEVGLGAQGVGGSASARNDDAEALAALVAGEADGLGEIAVVADDDAAVVAVVPGVVQEVDGEVDVRRLLFGLEDTNGAAARSGVGEGGRTVWVRKWPKWMESAGTVARSARRYASWRWGLEGSLRVDDTRAVKYLMATIWWEGPRTVAKRAPRSSHFQGVFLTAT